jgi:putative oxidoreductase
MILKTGRKLINMLTLDYSLFMIDSIFYTSNDYVPLILRVVAGVIILPYGMQKLFGWFPPLGGGIGIKGTLADFKAKKVPVLIAWLVILAQTLGSIGLIIGCLGRVAALGNFIIFAAAIVVHAPDGWAMNWTGRKKGEGIEYFILLLSILLIIIIKGSGAWSVDYWITHFIGNFTI